MLTSPRNYFKLRTAEELLEVDKVALSTPYQVSGLKDTSTCLAS